MGLACQKLIVQKMFNRKKFCFNIIYNFCIQSVYVNRLPLRVKCKKRFFFCTEKVTIKKYVFQLYLPLLLTKCSYEITSLQVILKQRFLMIFPIFTIYDGIFSQL